MGVNGKLKNLLIRIQFLNERVYKPDSVSNRLWLFILKDFYKSFLATYPRNIAENQYSFFYLVLLQVGFTMPFILLWMRWALTSPFHPYLINRRYVFCCTFPKVSPAGSYPALFSVESGLSSVKQQPHNSLNGRLKIILIKSTMNLNKILTMIFVNFFPSIINYL